MIPATDVTSLAARLALTVSIMGIPPATAASYFRDTPCCSASKNSSPPWSASKALLAVMTCFFCCNASITSSFATVVPPISSINTSTSGSRATANTSRESLASPISTSGLGVRVPICVTTRCAADRAEIVALPSPSSAKTPCPTVPRPHRPTRTVRFVTLVPNRWVVQHAIPFLFLAMLAVFYVHSQ